MRGPSVWSVAVRTPDGDIAEVTKSSARRCSATASGGSRDPRRHRARRVARDRLPRARHLRELRRAGGGRGRARRSRREISRGQIIFSFVIAIGFALMLFKVGPALLTSWLPIDGTYSFVVVEGADPGRGVHRLHRPDRAAAGPEARVPVPRRRAQGDQRARGRLRAHAREGAEVQLDPSTLRNCFFALGHGDRRSSSSPSSGGPSGTG